MTSEQRAYLERTGAGLIIDKLLVDLVQKKPLQPMRHCVSYLKRLRSPSPSSTPVSRPISPSPVPLEGRLRYGRTPPRQTLSLKGSQQSLRRSPSTSTVRQGSSSYLPMHPSPVLLESEASDTPRSTASAVTSPPSPTLHPTPSQQSIGTSNARTPSIYSKSHSLLLSQRGSGVELLRSKEDQRDAVTAALLRSTSMWTYDKLLEKVFKDPVSQILLGDPVFVGAVIETLATQPAGKDIEVVEALDLWWYFAIAQDSEAGLEEVHLDMARACTVMLLEEGHKEASGLTSPLERVLTVSPTAQTPLCGLLRSSPGFLQCPLGWQYMVATRLHYEVIPIGEPTSILTKDKLMFRTASYYKETLERDRAEGTSSYNCTLLRSFPIHSYPVVALLTAQRMVASPSVREEWDWVAQSLTSSDSEHCFLNVFTILTTYVWLRGARDALSAEQLRELYQYIDQHIRPVVERLLQHPNYTPSEPRPSPFKFNVNTATSKEDGIKGSLYERLLWTEEVAQRTTVTRYLEVLRHLAHAGWPSGPAAEWWIETFGRRPLIEVEEVELAMMKNGSLDPERMCTMSCPYPRPEILHAQPATPTSPVASFKCTATRVLQRTSFLKSFAEKGVAMGVVSRPDRRCVLRPFLDYVGNGSCSVLQFRVLHEYLGEGNTRAGVSALMRIAGTGMLLFAGDSRGMARNAEAIVVYQSRCVPQPRFTLEGGPRSRSKVSRNSQGNWICSGWSPQKSLVRFLETYQGTLSGAGNVYPADFSKALTMPKVVSMWRGKAEKDAFDVAGEVMLHFRPMATLSMVEGVADDLRKLGGCTPERLAVAVVPRLLLDLPSVPVTAVTVGAVGLLWERLQRKLAKGGTFADLAPSVIFGFNGNTDTASTVATAVTTAGRVQLLRNKDPADVAGWLTVPEPVMSLLQSQPSYETFLQRCYPILHRFVTSRGGEYFVKDLVGGEDILPVLRTWADATDVPQDARGGKRKRKKKKGGG